LKYGEQKNVCQLLDTNFYELCLKINYNKIFFYYNKIYLYTIIMNLLDKIKLKKNKYDTILNKYKYNYFITDDRYLSLIKFNKKIKKSGGNLEYKLNDIKLFLTNRNNINDINGINSKDDIDKINIYIEEINNNNNNNNNNNSNNNNTNNTNNNSNNNKYYIILQKILLLIAYQRNLYNLYENIIKTFINSNNKYDNKFKNLISDIIVIIKNEFYKNNLDINKYKSFLNNNIFLEKS